MAESDKILSKDIIDDNIFINAKKNALEFNTALKDMREGLTDVVEKNTALLSQFKDFKNADGLKKVNATLTENKNIRESVQLIDKQIIENEIQIQKLNQQKIKTQKDQITLSNLEQKNAQKLAKEIENQNSAYKKSVKELSEVKKKLKDLSVEGKSNTQTYKELNKVFERLDKDVRKAEQSVGEFQREVGNYKEAMKGAIAESDAFNSLLAKTGVQGDVITNSLGKVVETLKNMRKAQDASATGFQKVGGALKASGIALILVAITGIVSAFSAGREGALKMEIAMANITARIDAIREGFANFGSGLIEVLKGIATFDGSRVSAGIDKVKNSFDGYSETVDKLVPLIKELAQATFDYEDKLRALNLQLNTLKLDEEDLKNISNDVTIGYKERNAALEQAFVKRKEIAKTEIEIAKGALALALKQQEIDRAKGITQTSTLDAINNAKIAQENAEDSLNDLQVENARERRARFQAQILEEVELLRSKKLNADASVQLLTEQLNNEKIQLEQRNEIARELLKENTAETQKEFETLAKTFTTSAQKQITLAELVATTDAIELAKRIKGLDLYEAGTQELAKIVAQAQNDKIANDKVIAKLEQERLDRIKKIAEIEAEIAIINQNEAVNNINDLLQQKVDAYEKSNAEILENENVFNKKMEAERKANFEAEKAVLDKSFEEQKRLNDLKLQSELQKNTDTENDLLIRAEKEKKIRLEAEIESNNLKEKTDKAKKDLNEKELEEVKAIEIKKTEILLDNLQKVSAEIANELDKRAEREQEKFDRKISKQQTEIERQQKLAEKGLDNQLAFEEAQLEKSLLAKQEAEEKANRQKEIAQLVDTYFNSLQARLKQPNVKPQQAPALALGDTLLAKGLAKGLVQFAKDGNENVQAVNGGGAIGVDDIPFMLTKGEGVVTRDGNLGNKGVVKALNEGTFKEQFIKKSELQNQQQQSFSNFISEQKEIINVLKSINNKPTQQVNVDGLGNLIETIYTRGQKTVIKHKTKTRI